MTPHLDSHTTTDVKPDMLSGVQTGNGIPHDRYDIRGIAHMRTNRKDNILMQRRQGQIFIMYIEVGQGTCKNLRLYTARAYTTLVVLVKDLRPCNNALLILSQITCPQDVRK